MSSALFGLAGMWLLCPVASALQLDIVATGLIQPVYVTAPAGDSRLFIVERRGVIKILKDGLVLGTPFLNISDLVDTSGERGLLGLAFDPDFAGNRRFFVNYIDKATYATIVELYEVSNTDPDLADAATRQIVMTIPQPAGRNTHKAGWIGFRSGEPTHLYVATGDGGAAWDPDNRAQNLADNLGKVLRIDVASDRLPDDPDRYGYAIPADNPFVSGGGNPEIYAYGLRNPYRNSFDRETGTFFIADVGQDYREEIHIGAPGANYGWRKYEGTVLVYGDDPEIANHAAPLYEYGHEGGGAAIIGGYVYRGSLLDELRGTYFFADFVTSAIMSFRYTGSAITALTDHTVDLLSSGGISGAISSFGEDGFGNLYVVSLRGQIGRIAGALRPPPAHAPSDFDANRKSDILWRNATSGDNAMWQGAGTRTLILSVPDTNWAIKAVGNFAGLAQPAGILWRNNQTGDNAIWLMDGAALASSRLLPAVTSSEWSIAGAGDFDADARTDILWRNSRTGENAIWLLNGTDVASTRLIHTVSDVRWTIAGVGDFDGDGQSDILWRHSDTNDVAIWLMSGYTLRLSALLQAVPPAWAIESVADYDGDGRADILWRNTMSGENAIWLMDGLTLRASGLLPSLPELAWSVASSGDYNGDGRADILWRNKATGAVRIWLMNGLFMAAQMSMPTVPDPAWTIIRSN